MGQVRSINKDKFHYEMKVKGNTGGLNITETIWADI